MKKENKIVKVIRYSSLLLVIALGLVSIIGTGGGSGGGGGGGGGSTPLTTGEFTKTVTLASADSWAFPFSAVDIHHQQLYRAGDIDGAGYIQSIELRLHYDTTGCSCPDATIKMGHTSLGGLTTTFANNVQEGKGTLETVREGAFSVPAGSAGEYFTIPLDTPFLYNGVDNLVVEFLVEDCGAQIGFRRDNTTLLNGALYQFNLTSPTGSLHTTVMHTKFNFEGGVDALEFAATAGSGDSIPLGGQRRKVQLLYGPADINGSGPITGIAMRVGSGTTTDQSYTYTMRVGHSTLTDLTTDFNRNFSSTPVTVADNAVFNVPHGIPVGDYIWIPMPDGCFNYNGSDSLIVEIDVSAFSGPASWSYILTSGNTRAYGNSGSATATGVDVYQYDISFRFKGGPMDVITAENNSWSVPFLTGDNKTQFLFDAWQFGTGGSVTGISFRLHSDSALCDYPSATVVLDHTANTTLSATFADNLTNPSTVFTGTLNVPAGLEAGDWVTIPVSGFTYDPTQNLVVEVTHDGGTVLNIILSTNTDVPGASGMVNGPRASSNATGNSPGQCDIRISLSK